MPNSKCQILGPFSYLVKDAGAPNFARAESSNHHRRTHTYTRAVTHTRRGRARDEARKLCSKTARRVTTPRDYHSVSPTFLFHYLINEKNTQNSDIHQISMFSGSCFYFLWRRQTIKSFMFYARAPLFSNSTTNPNVMIWKRLNSSYFCCLLPLGNSVCRNHVTRGVAIYFDGRKCVFAGAPRTRILPGWTWTRYCGFSTTKYIARWLLLYFTYSVASAIRADAHALSRSPFLLLFCCSDKPRVSFNLFIYLIFSDSFRIFLPNCGPWINRLLWKGNSAFVPLQKKVHIFCLPKKSLLMISSKIPAIFVVRGPALAWSQLGVPINVDDTIYVF